MSIYNIFPVQIDFCAHIVYQYNSKSANQIWQKFLTACCFLPLGSKEIIKWSSGKMWNITYVEIIPLNLHRLIHKYHYTIFLYPTSIQYPWFNTALKHIDQILII